MTYSGFILVVSRTNFGWCIRYPDWLFVFVLSEVSSILLSFTLYLHYPLSLSFLKSLNNFKIIQNVSDSTESLIASHVEVKPISA
jgi:hypothetical protein